MCSITKAVGRRWQILMDFQNPYLANKGQGNMLEVIKAKQKNTSNLRKPQQGADCLQNGSEVDSIIGHAKAASGKL
jgi:hypothetical protein